MKRRESTYLVGYVLFSLYLYVYISVVKEIIYGEKISANNLGNGRYFFVIQVCGPNFWNEGSMGLRNRQLMHKGKLMSSFCSIRAQCHYYSLAVHIYTHSPTPT
ncbi:hypothetical protein S83_050053 [Arachis hypogaea]